MACPCWDWKLNLWPWKQQCYQLNLLSRTNKDQLNFLFVYWSHAVPISEKEATVTGMLHCNTWWKGQLLSAWSCRTSLCWEWEWRRSHWIQSIWNVSASFAVFALACAYASYAILLSWTSLEKDFRKLVFCEIFYCNCLKDKSTFYCHLSIWAFED